MVFTLDQASLHESLRYPVLGSIDFVKDLTMRLPDAISFALGAPHRRFLEGIDISGYIERYLRHVALEHGLGPRTARRLLHQYGPSRGLINDLVAEALRQDEGINASPEAVVITVGAQEAMLLALRALFGSPGDLLAVTDPSYFGIIGAARLLDIPVVGIADRGTGFDFDGLVAACKAARAGGRRIRALYVIPDFANPAGTVLALAERMRLLDVAEQHDLLLIEDNAYGFTAAPGTALPTVKALDGRGRTVYLGTFAKVCLPGARVGFAVADQPVRGTGGQRRLLADELAALKSMVTVNTSPICQAIVGGMLLEHGGSLASIARDRSELYRRNLDLLLAALDRHFPAGVGCPPGLSWNTPAGGMFVRMCLPVPADAALLELSGERFGVLWTPLSMQFVGGGGAKELRLSCSDLNPSEIDEGVARLAKLLRSLELD